MTDLPKRLIEVDLPIRRISEHARREKSIRHGHISTLHIWWARRPLAACRAVLCASLWPDPADPNCPAAINAPLLDAARQALAFIDKHTFHPRRTVGLNNVRFDEYPEDALREALINALAHRDYADATRKIILRIFSDRIEVSSPGYPLKPLTISKLEKGKYRPCSRNPLISQTLALMHQMEQRGTGFARMRDAMLNHGLDAPGLSRSDGYFVVTLPGPDGDYDRIRVTGKVAGPVTPAIEEQLAERQKRILIEVQKSGFVTSSWCQKNFGIVRDTANRDLSGLAKLNLLKKTGKGRGTKYVLQFTSE